MCSRIRRNPSDISKGLLQVRVLAPQPATVVSVDCFRLQNNLTTFPEVSARSVGLCSGKICVLWPLPQFLRASLWSRISDIQILLLETRFDSTETGSTRAKCVYDRAASLFGTKALGSLSDNFAQPPMRRPIIKPAALHPHESSRRACMMRAHQPGSQPLDIPEAIRTQQCRNRFPLHLLHRANRSRFQPHKTAG